MEEKILTEIAELKANQQRIEQLLSRLLEKETTTPEKEIMNTKEVAEYLGISVGRVWNLVSEGKIPHGKNGRNFFRKSEIDTWRFGTRIKTNDELAAEVEAKAKSKAKESCLNDG